MFTRRHVIAGALGLGAVGAFAAPKALVTQARGAELMLGRQQGVLYIPTHVMEAERLIEKHTSSAGLEGMKVTWEAFANSSTQREALLEGRVHIAASGIGPLLLMWDRTRGRVQGMFSISAQPLSLVTREDRVRRLEDYRSGDRIAVPTLAVSTQAILLQMAARSIYGESAWAHFDAMMVQKPHGEALSDMRTGNIGSHFGAPPFDFYEESGISGARVVATSDRIMGGPLSQATFITTTDFANENGPLIEAVRAAATEAIDMVKSDIGSAIDIYRRVTGDGADPGLLREMFARPGMMDWEMEPQGTQRVAAHLASIGTLRNGPSGWEDYFLAQSHDMAGS